MNESRRDVARLLTTLLTFFLSSVAFAEPERASTPSASAESAAPAVPAAPPTTAALPSLILLPSDNSSLHVLEELCKTVKANGDGLPYSAITLMPDPEGRIRKLAMEAVARGERGDEARKLADETVNAHLKLTTVTFCLGTASASLKDSDVILLSWDGDSYYFSTAGPGSQKLTNGGTSTRISKTSAAGVARALAWQTLDLSHVELFQVAPPKVNTDAAACGRLRPEKPSGADWHNVYSDSGVPGDLSGCRIVGEQATATLVIRTSAWVSADTIPWEANLVCKGQDDVFLGKSQPAGKTQEDRRSVETELNFTPLKVGACRVTVRASLRLDAERTFERSGQSAEVRLELPGILLDPFAERLSERYRHSDLALTESAILFGTLGESTNRAAIEYPLWRAQSVSGASLVRLGVELRRALRAIPVEHGFEDTVNGALDRRFKEQGDLLARVLFENSRAGFSDGLSHAPLCVEMLRLLEQEAKQMESVSSFPDEWFEACDSKTRELATTDGEIAAWWIEPVGTAPSTAIPALRGRGTRLAIIAKPKAIFSATVDKPFRRNESYRARAILADGSMTEAVTWKVHQTAAPLDVRLGSYTGVGVITDNQRSSDGAGIHYKSYADFAKVFGLSASVSLFRDLLAVRVNPQWLWSRTISRSGTVVAGELNYACMWDRLMRMWSDVLGPSIANCPTFGGRLVGGYFIGQHAVHFGFQGDAGFHAGDVLFLAGGIGAFADVSTRPLPRPRREMVSSPFDATLQIHLMGTFLDPTAF